MAVRVRHVERVTQPQEAAGVDWSNQYAATLAEKTALFIPHDQLKDLSTRNSSVSGNVSQDLADGILAWQFDGSSKRVDTGVGAFSNAQGTVLWAQRPTTAYNSGTVRGIWGQLRSANSIEFSAQVWTDNNWYVGFNGVANTRVVTAASASNWTQNRWSWYAYSWGPFGQELYQDGALIGSNGTAPSSLSALDGGQENIWLGYVTSTTGWFAGHIAEFAIFPTAFRGADVAALHCNPWQLFEPEQIVVNLGAATGPTYTLTAATGSFTLTGQSVNLVVSRKLTASTGSFTLTGQSANLVVTRKLTTETGTFTLTGQSANLQVSRKLVADTGAFSLTGIAVNLVYTPVSSATYTLTAQTGVFNLTGQAAAFKVSRKLVAETVSFSFVGNDANFYPGGIIPVTTKGGKGQGKNLTLKQKKKLKAVVSQEWLKAEQTAKELLQERLGNVEPAKVRVERLTTVQSLADVIAALQALSKETVTLPEQQAVIKSFEKSIDTKVIKTGERLVAVEDKVNETLGRIEKKIQNLEDLLIVVIDELL